MPSLPFQTGLYFFFIIADSAPRCQVRGTGRGLSRRRQRYTWFLRKNQGKQSPCAILRMLYRLFLQDLKIRVCFAPTVKKQQKSSVAFQIFFYIIFTSLCKGKKPMFNEDFSRRLSQLRTGKGVSARDMSLSIGQNAGYINSIEDGKSLPSMTVFISICG
jgi:DNA-binding XRE family transcriptional regulator